MAEGAKRGFSQRGLDQMEEDEDHWNDEGGFPEYSENLFINRTELDQRGRRDADDRTRGRINLPDRQARDTWRQHDEHRFNWNGGGRNNDDTVDDRQPRFAQNADRARRGIDHNFRRNRDSQINERIDRPRSDDATTDVRHNNHNFRDRRDRNERDNSVLHNRHEPATKDDRRRRDFDGYGGNNDRRQGSGGQHRVPGRKRELSVKFLSDLLHRQPSDILLTISNTDANLREALVACKQEPKKLRLLLSVLAIAFSCNSANEHLNRVNIIIKESGFLNTCANYFLDMQGEDSLTKLQELIKTLKDMMVIMSEMAKKNPDYVTEFLGTYSSIEIVINSLRQRTDLIDGDVLDQFKNFTIQKDRIVKKKHQRRDQPIDADISEPEPPDDFRDIAIFPQTADMEDRNDRYLRGNKVYGRYHDLDHYLDVQFRLLREDFVAPLRSGISNYVEFSLGNSRQTQKTQEIRIYHGVQVLFPVCSENGLCHVLQFDMSRMGNIRWQSSKRLIYGSLICLSCDNFKTLYFATVANRQVKDLQKGLIQVQFEHGNETVKKLFGSLFTMAETTAYFESYRHVLLGLQRTREGDLPFERYIISCDSAVKPPSYLSHGCKFDLRPLVDEEVKVQTDTRLENLGEVVPVRQVYNFSQESQPAEKVQILDRTSWPPADLLHLDESQFKAVHTALTKEFALVQGPPGTGKTYIGLKIVKALLHNKDSWSVNPVTMQKDIRPMLIVCYTNHALDQFLEGIIKFFEGDLVRVGGRSSSDVLKEFNLHNFKQRFRHAQKVPVQVFQGRREAKNEMEAISREINTIAAQVEILAVHVIHEMYLQPYIGPYHFNRLKGQFDAMLEEYSDSQLPSIGSSVIVEWLGLGNLAPIVELKANLEQNGPPQEMFQDAEDDFVDVEDEVDTLQSQRQLDFEDLSDEDEDILLTKREKDERRKQRVVSGFMHKVAFNVERIDVMKDDGGWQQTKREKKKLKKNIQRNLCSTEIMSEEEANAVHDLWRMHAAQKWRLYRLWIQRYKHSLLSGLDEKLKEYEEASKRYKEVSMQEDKEILRQSTVIGMTTSGAARYQTVLQEIGPRIIVVEEAAEVLEAHVITTLSKGCQHLILIGDHKQLRPNPTVYKLAKDYNLDVSLFERMISNKIQCDCLKLQHRMRPEISELMQPIYGDLLDHDVVKTYPNIKGVSKNLYFISHNERESDDIDLRSHSNKFEADYIVALCNYLLLQGYKASQITVLTLYSGQLFTLKALMPKERFEGIRVTVVDSYQGEENDIILLSLVRSNEDDNIGFLKTENRICVALSRAKMGLYVIGNFDLLASQSSLWKELTIDMRKKDRLGTALKLYCQNHPDSDSIMAKTAADFAKAPEGGCDKPCTSRLKCGHTCTMYCHVQDADHEDFHCTKQCNKEICANKHRCKKRCFEPCGVCYVMVAKKIPQCNHTRQVPCSVPPANFTCDAKCDYILECGHTCKNPCGRKHTESCQEKIVKKWSCGHEGQVKCAEIDVAVCTEPCSEHLSCVHLCSGTCGKCLQGRLHQPCDNVCNRQLICGHACKDKCSRCPPCTQRCENTCIHSKCHKKCGELCTPCMEPCAWKCEHYKCTKLCSEPCDRPRCNKPCKKRLVCDHLCIGLCGEPCPTDCRKCDEEKVTELLFGDEDEPGAQFVCLTDCRNRCIIEAKAMDKYMDQSAQNGEISLKTCPKCKTSIRKSVRYGNIINLQLKDIEGVKKTILSSERRLRELEDNLREELKPDSDLSDDAKCIFRRRLNALIDLKSEELLVAMQNQISFLKEIEKLECEWKKLEGIAFRDDKIKGLNNLCILKDWALVERSYMAKQEIDDCTLELSRSKAHVKVLMYQQKAKQMRIMFDMSLKANIREVETILAGREKYNPQNQTLVKRCLQDLEKAVPSSGLGISENERMQILEAMAMPKGHWFKCKNGHIYAIGDCGGAMEESTCPDCKATIGGGNHRLHQGNTLANEMDGARHAAWSEMANLQNFQF